MTIGEFFGTLQESITTEWRKHLQTKKYSTHMALDEYYKEMPEKVDALIEAWQADNEVVQDYKNTLEPGDDALKYLESLKDFVQRGRTEFFKDKSELESLTDDILSLIDSTIYKLKHLTESITDHLYDVINCPIVEINEAVADWNTITSMIVKDIENGKASDMKEIYKLVKKLKPTKGSKTYGPDKWIGFSIRKADSEWSKKGDISDIYVMDERDKEHKYLCAILGAEFVKGSAEEPTYGTNSFTFQKSKFTKQEVYEMPAEYVSMVLTAIDAHS